MPKTLYYCYGCPNTSGVVKALLSRYPDAIVSDEYDYSKPDQIYFVNEKNNIDFCLHYSSKGVLIQTYGEELRVPSASPKLKVVRGISSRGKDVIKFLTSMGGTDVIGLNGDDEEHYYFITETGVIDHRAIYENVFFDNYELEVLECPKALEKVEKYLSIFPSTFFPGTLAVGTMLYDTPEEALNGTKSIGYVKMESYLK